MLSHDDLGNYYRLNFSLMHDHGFSLTELEDMMPWERDVYTGLLIGKIRAENEKARLREQTERNRF